MWDWTWAPLHWEHRLLTTGSPGKSRCSIFSKNICGFWEWVISWNPETVLWGSWYWLHFVNEGRGGGVRQGWIGSGGRAWRFGEWWEPRLKQEHDRKQVAIRPWGECGAQWVWICWKGQAMKFGPEPEGSEVKSGRDHFYHLLLPSPASRLWGILTISCFSLLFSKLGIFSSFFIFCNALISCFFR